MAKQTKNKKIYWLHIIVVGIAFGFALQFVRAWTEPTSSPPEGNLGAPLNTSFNNQVKGNATQGKLYAADFCLNSDTTKCLSTVGGVSTPVTAGTCTSVAFNSGAGYVAEFCDPTLFNPIAQSAGWPSISEASNPGVCDPYGRCDCAYGSVRQVGGTVQWNYYGWTGFYRNYTCQL